MGVLTDRICPVLMWPTVVTVYVYENYILKEDDVNIMIVRRWADCRNERSLNYARF